MKHKIFLVEAESLIRQGLTVTLEEDPDFKVCGQSATAEDAVLKLEKCDADLVITAIDLPDHNGLELTRVLIERDPELHILVVSDHDEGICAERALRAGALGYVVKRDAADCLLQAAHTVLRGCYFLSEEINNLILNAVAQSQHPLLPAPSDVLSRREMELFELTGRGLSTHEIAERMGLSVKTVESYRNRAKQKLKLRSSNELIRRAVMWHEGGSVCMTWDGCCEPQKTLVTDGHA